MKEDEIGSRLMSVIEGTDFDRKMDEMFSKMFASGMSEKQIMETILSKMNPQKLNEENQEIAPLDSEMLKMFTKVL